MEKILIIDDSIFNIKVLSSVLEETYDIFSSKDGEEGLRLAKVVSPSLILLDVLMPGIDGFQVLQRLKEDHATKDIPVIFMTSLTNAESEEKGFTLGAVDYITKPFNPSIVQARVKTHVELFSYRKMIENLAMLDGLTGIPNRRNYDERATQEWDRAKRDQQPLSFAILDVDSFKNYNDTYGHLKGDDALKCVAATIKKSLRRAGDYVARYGGEEFAVILPNTHRCGAIQLAEAIRSSIEELQIPHKKSNSGILTISIGGATAIPALGDEFLPFAAETDKMLYKAKETGKNKVQWTDALL